MSSPKSPGGHRKLMNKDDAQMQEEDSSDVQENLIEKLYEGMKNENILKLDPDNVRKDEGLDISKLPKVIDTQLALQGWNSLKRLNV